jgi:putative flippase GtrA
MKTLRRKKMRQFIKFNFVGLLNTVLDFAVFTLLTWLGVYYILAQCLSYGVGMLNSYALNKYWTFAQKGHLDPKQAIRFIVLNLGSLLLSLGLLAIFRDQWMVKVLVAKLLTTVITTLVNYAGNKLWVFRANETKYS